MSNLSIDERIKLEEISTGYFYKLEKPGQHLKSLVNISQIQVDTAGIDYNLPVRELIPNFYPEIFKSRENSLSFLRVFRSHLLKDSDEQLFVNKIIAIIR